jgi:hypothetical protein
VFSGRGNDFAFAWHGHLMSFIFTPTIDIHTMPVVFKVFFGYFAFTPVDVTLKVETMNLCR